MGAFHEEAAVSVDEHAPPEEDDRLIGSRIRTLRVSKAMSAKDVAHRAGVSAAYLSRLENEKVSPTVATLSRVVQAMGETIGTLFGDPVDDGPVVRADRRRRVNSKGVHDYRVTPGWATRLEVLESVVEPGQGSSPDLHTHPGDEECVLVLEGELTVWIGDAEHRLATGDSATYACRSPHRWRNPTERTCRVLWIFTPASY
jgi:transcriptional regulator with XRE-family HTH domain